MKGYARQDGRKGIRNYVLVVYLVECAHHVAREIALPWRDTRRTVDRFFRLLSEHLRRSDHEAPLHASQTGAVLLVSLGCESFHRRDLAETVRQSGRPVHTLVIQETGGTRATTAAGRAWVEQVLRQLNDTPRVEMDLSDLVVGTICGGSDATSGLTANPVIGKAFDWLVDHQATAIFEETNELIGCEEHLAGRAITPGLAKELTAAVVKAEQYHRVLGHGSFALGNAEGGLTTQEEKSLGAYAKSGCRPVSGLLKPGDLPPRGGLYLLDVVPDGEVRFGFPNISDNTEAADLMSCGTHLILFSTGRGSVVGSAIAPIVKVCANPETYRHMREDMDVDAGRILEDRATLDEVAEELIDRVISTAEGEPTASESLGHQEFLLTLQVLRADRPNCLPMVDGG